MADAEKTRPLSARRADAWWVAAVIVAVLAADQILKIWVKTHMYLGEDIEILPWWQIRFIQNNGMAFGMEIGSKLFLSLFRLVVIAAVICYVVRLLRGPSCVPRGYLVCLALIIAGATGNLIDCAFYGLVFDNPLPPEVAQFVPWGDGYAAFLHGQVVDMLYFPLFSGMWPDWVPGWGGQTFSFFDPVFNIADASISVGIVILIIFYSRCIGRSEQCMAEAKDEKA